MKRNILTGDFLGRLEAMELLLKTKMRGLFGGTHKTKTYGATVEFADFREYVPGDDIRRIDWNVYGRFEKYFIKLFTDERQMQNQFFVDCSASMEHGDPEKATYALRLAAAFAYLSVATLDRSMIRLLKDHSCTDLCPAFVGKSGFYRAASLMENVRFAGDTDLSEAITHAEKTGVNDGLTVLISDFLTDSDWKKAVDFLTYRHREVLCVQILSPDEIDPSLHGRVHLIDKEASSFSDGRNMKMKMSRNILKAYNEALEDYRRELREFCTSRGADFISVSTDTPVETVLFGRNAEIGGLNR